MVDVGVHRAIEPGKEHALALDIARDEGALDKLVGCGGAEPAERRGDRGLKRLETEERRRRGIRVDVVRSRSDEAIHLEQQAGHRVQQQALEERWVGLMDPLAHLPHEVAVHDVHALDELRRPLAQRDVGIVLEAADDPLQTRELDFEIDGRFGLSHRTRPGPS